MKKLSLLAILPLLALSESTKAETSIAVLEQRCSEQERQIRQLEEENSRLRSLLETSSRTQTTTKTVENATQNTPPAPDPKPVYYTVSRGDTLSRIARKNGTTPEVLVKLNKLKDASLIRLGQKLLLPAKEVPVADAGTRKPEPKPAEKVTNAPSARGGTHTVKEGETFFGIARKYGLSVETLAEANPNANPRAIQVGQSLKLVPRETEAVAQKPPATKAADAPQLSSTESPKPVSNKPLIRSVRIEKEITFGDFAKAHGMEPAKLNALNGLHLETNTVLAKGSELYVSAQP
ncbi:LysM peptidoglycan-binding domain-containing protein [Haloferula sp.]|uniref:LysM peptidoglycan-binding domain-containing protein n=1 Tax=Haloferula sp. TaxID=2497595 RepID=UPI003C764695